MSTIKFKAKLVQRFPAVFLQKDGKKVALLTATDDKENTKARYVIIHKVNVHHSEEYGYVVYSIRRDQAWVKCQNKSCTMSHVAWYGKCRRVGIYL